MHESYLNCHYFEKKKQKKTKYFNYELETLGENHPT
jgi:hypothetical protein